MSHSLINYPSDQNPLVKICDGTPDGTGGQALNDNFKLLADTKVALKTVATTGSYNDLTDKPTIPSVTGKMDKSANLSDVASAATARTNLGLATVANTGSYNDLTSKPSIPAAQVNCDWNATTGVAAISNKPSLATVATTGSYNDLSDKPTISGGSGTPGGTDGQLQFNDAGALGGASIVYAPTRKTFAIGNDAEPTNYGQIAISNGKIDVAGDNQASTFILRCFVPTGTTNIEAFLDGASERITLPQGAVWGYTCHFAALDWQNNPYTYWNTGLIVNSGGATTVTMNTPITNGSCGTPPVISDAGTGTGEIKVVLNELSIYSTKWVCKIETVEINPTGDGSSSSSSSSSDGEQIYCITFVPGTNGSYTPAGWSNPQQTFYGTGSHNGATEFVTADNNWHIWWDGNNMWYFTAVSSGYDTTGGAASWARCDNNPFGIWTCDGFYFGAITVVAS